MTAIDSPGAQGRRRPILPSPWSLGAAVIAALNENEAGLSVAGLTVSRLHFLTESTGPGRTERSKQSDALFEVVLDEAP